ncbi:MAG TPA: hypothetical protein VFU73_00560 [Actinocrinis sp.]|nr:hypothetical protein [Actinocrinis sp.]
MPTESQSPASEPGPAESRPADAAPRFTRATLALTAAATLAVAPVATLAFGPAGSGASAHTSPVYVLAQAAHDIGHNDWAFQGGLAGRIEWVATYLVLGLFWLVAALWMRWRVKRAGIGRADSRRRLWIKALIAAWAAEAVAGSLTLGAGMYVAWGSAPLGPAVLRAVDVCSPWWSFVAVLLVVGLAEHRRTALRAAILYGSLLAVLLLVPVPGPDAVKVLVLATAAAALALLDTGPAAGASPVTPDAVAAY